MATKRRPSFPFHHLPPTIPPPLHHLLVLVEATLQPSANATLKKRRCSQHEVRLLSPFPPILPPRLPPPSTKFPLSPLIPLSPKRGGKGGWRARPRVRSRTRIRSPPPHPPTP